MKLYYYILTVVLLIGFFSCQEKTNISEPLKEQQADTGFWYQQPLRIQQTVLRQTDAKNYNVDSVISYLKGIHANVLVINAGGVVDFFQNELPMARINPYMGERDILKEIVTACHQNHIKVIGRVDFRGVEKARYDKHPDWFGTDEKGDPLLLTYTNPVMYAPCYNSYYRNEHAVDFISTILKKYQVDGIWHNAVNFHQTCYCSKCSDKFREFSGKKIPDDQSSELDWELYFKWKAQNASEQLALMRNTVKKFGEDKAYTAEVFNMFDVEQQKHTGIDLYSAAEYFDFLVTVSFIADNRPNVEYKDLSYGATIIKFLKSLNSKKSPVILFGGNGTEHRYIYDPPIDLRQWLWEAAGNGGGFWNCYFNGFSPAATLDTRNAYLPKDAYQFTKKNEKILQHIEPVKDVAIYYSRSSAQLLGDEAFSYPIRGIIRMLQDAHYQYGFITDFKLTRKDLDNCRVLILPNVVHIDKKKANLIREWVKDGGNLIATSETSLYNENHSKRDDFLLQDLFGVHFTGETADTQMDCYQKILERNEFLSGFEKTHLLHNGGRTLLVNAKENTIKITGYLPKIQNQPPEHAFPESWESEYPIMTENRFGEGRIVYFANEPCKLNYSIGHPDYHDLLKNTIEVLLGGKPSLRSNAPASVHIYLNKSLRDSLGFQISLVNTSSGTGRPIRDLIPVRDIEIRLLQNISHCELMSNRNAEFSYQDNVIKLEYLEEFCSFWVEVE